MVWNGLQKLIAGGSRETGDTGKIIKAGTDVAAFMIFHPNDLQHAKYWPIAWYADHFIYSKESEAGKLIAWDTGMDGSFELRLTMDGLTRKEKSKAGAQYDFPITVRHNRLFVDNSDCLPGDQQMYDAADYEDAWYDIPNGDYVATVTAILQNGEKKRRLPDYVIAFRLATEGTMPSPARRPPDLICHPDCPATDEVTTDMDAGFEIGPAPLLPERPVPCIPTGSLRLTDPAIHITPRTLGCSDFLHQGKPIKDFWDDEDAFRIVLAPDSHEGTMSILAQFAGYRTVPVPGSEEADGKREIEYIFRNLGIARIADAQDAVHGQADQAPELPTVSLAPVSPADNATSDVDIADLKAMLEDRYGSVQALHADAEKYVLDRASGRHHGSDITDRVDIRSGINGMVEYGIREMKALKTIRGVTGWALARLPVPAKRGLELAVANDRTRVEGILDLLNDT